MPTSTQALVHLNQLPFTDFRFPINVTSTFTESISDVKLKLVKTKKQDKKVWIKLRYQYTLYMFNLQTFLIFLNTTLD